jgi:hypothetical protein
VLHKEFKLYSETLSQNDQRPGMELSMSKALGSIPIPCTRTRTPTYRASMIWQWDNNLNLLKCIFFNSLNFGNPFRKFLFCLSPFFLSSIKAQEAALSVAWAAPEWQLSPCNAYFTSHTAPAPPKLVNDHF